MLIGDYTTALEQVQVATTLASSDTLILRRALEQRRSIYKHEAAERIPLLEDSIAQLDVQLSLIARDFSTQSEQTYDTEPKHVHRRLTAQAQGATPHLRAMVTPEGLSIVSVYAGSSGVGHTALRLVAEGGAGRYETPQVAPDGALNYTYYDGVRQWELVTYPPESCSQMGAFIAELSEGSRLRVELLAGDKIVARWTISPSDLSALRATIDLAHILDERKHMDQRLGMYRQRLYRLDTVATETSNASKL